MPVWRFLDPDAAARALPRSPSAEAGILTAVALGGLDAATFRGIRVSQRGIHKYATVAEGEADRERHALSCLRSGGESPAAPPPAPRRR